MTNIHINFNKNYENLEIYCLQVTGYLNKKKSFPICMFVVMALGKSDLHIHFTFLQEFLISTHTKEFNIFSHNICREVQQSIFSSP